MVEQWQALPGRVRNDEVADHSLAFAEIIGARGKPGVNRHQAAVSDYGAVFMLVTSLSP